MKQELVHQFYREYKAALIRFANALMHSQENAEEAVHNVFQKLWASNNPSEIKNPYPYLVQCTKFEAYAIIAKDKKEQEINLRYIQETEHLQDGNESSQDRLQNVRKAINLLPPKCKEVMLLKINEGLTHQEISSFLHISEKTIENQVSIAVKKIRAFLVNN